MAATTKTKSRWITPKVRTRRRPAAEKPVPTNFDYFVLATILVLMFALVALAIWLAGVGGDAVPSTDYWMLMP